MDWKTIYKERLKTAEEAVKLIQSGDRVVVGHAVGEPVYLVDKMVENYKAYKDVEVVHLVAMGHSLYAKPEMAGHFRHNALFLGGPTRDCINEGRGDFTPCFFYQTPELFRTDLPVDVALVQVSPPDENGYVSFGVSCDYSKPAAECAKLCIAQVNDKMPRTMGDCFLHV